MRKQENLHDFLTNQGWRNLVLAYQLTLSSPGGADSAHQITTRHSIFSDIPPSMPIRLL